MNAAKNGQQASAVANAYRNKRFTTRLLFRDMRIGRKAAGPGDLFP
jgi:hypothetical protein